MVCRSIGGASAPTYPVAMCNPCNLRLDEAILDIVRAIQLELAAFPPRHRIGINSHGLICGRPARDRRLVLGAPTRSTMPGRTGWAAGPGRPYCADAA